MEKLVFTPLSEPDVRRIVREEVKSVMLQCFKEQKERGKPEYMTIDQLADHLNTSVPAIYGKVHRRQIPFIKKGKRLMFNTRDIENWLKTGKVKTVTEIKNEAIRYVSESNREAY